MPYPWSAGNVLTATDLNSALAAKSDYAPTQNTQTGVGASAYTFVLADATRMTVANAATAATYTIPPAASVAFVANSIINVTSIGAGTVTFAAGAGVTVTNTAGTLGQYQSAMLVRTASNVWTVVPFAGGASVLKSTDVSATTGSPTISSAGGFTRYLFAANGTITLAKSGYAQCLVVGGGLNAQSGYTWTDARAGGAAGMVVVGAFVLPSGTSTITVGAAASRPSLPGASSIGTLAVAGGGTAANGGAGGAPNNYGVASDITGSNLEYGFINGSSDPAVTDSVYGIGSALNTLTGATAGVVIIRVIT